MFTIHCERCGRHSIAGWSRLIDVSDDHGVIVVTYHCYCGHVGQTLTGRGAPRRDELPAIGPSGALASAC